MNCRQEGVRGAWAAWLAFVVLAFPGDAHANIGLPMIFPSVFGMVLAFVPVVLLKALVLSRELGLPFGAVVWPVASANGWSTDLQTAWERGDVESD